MSIKILDVRKGRNRFAVTESEGWSEVTFGKTRQQAMEIARRFDKMRYEVTVIKSPLGGQEVYSVYIKK